MRRFKYKNEDIIEVKLEELIDNKTCLLKEEFFNLFVVGLYWRIQEASFCIPTKSKYDFVEPSPEYNVCMLIEETTRHKYSSPTVKLMWVEGKYDEIYEFCKNYVALPDKKEEK